MTIRLEITVNRAAADVWQRVGKFCDVAEWFGPIECKIGSGEDSEIGAVRRLGAAEDQILVGRTALSYTYTLPVREGRPCDLYHGTLEARPLTPTTSRLLYTLVFDVSMLPNDAVRQGRIDQFKAVFLRALENMKTISEAGTLPRIAADRTEEG